MSSPLQESQQLENYETTLKNLNKSKEIDIRMLSLDDKAELLIALWENASIHPTSIKVKTEDIPKKEDAILKLQNSNQKNRQLVGKFHSLTIGCDFTGPKLDPEIYDTLYELEKNNTIGLKRNRYVFKSVFEQFLISKIKDKKAQIKDKKAQSETTLRWIKAECSRLATEEMHLIKKADQKVEDELLKTPEEITFHFFATNLHPKQRMEIYTKVKESFIERVKQNAFNETEASIGSELLDKHFELAWLKNQIFTISDSSNDLEFQSLSIDKKREYYNSVKGRAKDKNMRHALKEIEKLELDLSPKPLPVAASAFRSSSGPDAQALQRLFRNNLINLPSSALPEEPAVLKQTSSSPLSSLSSSSSEDELTPILNRELAEDSVKLESHKEAFPTFTLPPSALTFTRSLRTSSSSENLRWNNESREGIPDKGDSKNLEQDPTHTARPPLHKGLKRAGKGPKYPTAQNFVGFSDPFKDYTVKQREDMNRITSARRIVTTITPRGTGVEINS